VRRGLSAIPALSLPSKQAGHVEMLAPQTTRRPGAQRAHPCPAARRVTGRPPLKPGAAAGAGASALRVVGRAARAVTAPEKARRMPFVPAAAPQAHQRYAARGRAVLSRPELEAAPGAALAPSECPRLAQPRAPGKAIRSKRRDDQAQLCGRVRSRRRRVPPAEDQDTRTGRRRHPQ
jgi:hypothetical protein